MIYKKYISYCLSVICSKVFAPALLILTSFGFAFSTDLVVNGRVTDIGGSNVSNAKVSMFAGNTEYSALSRTDGTYSLKISGLYGTVSGDLEMGVPFPNPFTHSVYIPFMTSTSGEVLFSVFDIKGQKIRDLLYPSIVAGSYRLIWDGNNYNGTPVRQGFYIYVITFKGKKYSGRLIKASGYSTFAAANALETIQVSGSDPVTTGTLRIPVITNVDCKDYFPLNYTDIVLKRDTIIDFVLSKKSSLPFKAMDKYIGMYTGNGYRNMLLKGINLGSSPPGTFPGEIAYSIPDEMYKSWIARMAQAGFTTVRVYTLHPPIFYTLLDEYNQRHPDKPLLLFHGIWLEEMENPDDPLEYDLTLRESAFRGEIKDIIDCVHGKKTIPVRAGKAYGTYKTDVSRWTVGYVLGREIMSEEVLGTNSMHPSMNSYTGSQFSIKNATASEVFLTKMADEAVNYEATNYLARRPVAISSWPTLDPLTHSGEIDPREDSATLNVMKIEGRNLMAGMFVWYHAYPYHPNFISNQVSYRSFSDSQGPNSYLGYLTDLKNHYPGVPLVIGEYGVPSSWGSARKSYSRMDHGKMSEIQQGQYNIRMMHNIVDTGCAGGFMFAWMDEWFKSTWIVYYLEAYGSMFEGVLMPTRNLWHNITSPEENFGLLSFDEAQPSPTVTYQTDKPSGPLTRVDATNDNSFFFLDIQTSARVNKGDTIMVAFDTYQSNTGESKLPNGKQLSNRSEFLLTMVMGQDTALHHVTQAYDMKGITKYGDFSDHAVQRYKSTVSDGAPWVLMRWIDDPRDPTNFIGKLPAENASGFTAGLRTALAWSDYSLKIRIPWTMLNVYEPTQMKVIDGAVTTDGGNSFIIFPAISDGIAVSVYCKGSVTSSTSRYKWQTWTYVPPYKIREKKSLQIVEDGLKAFSSFIN
jgi:hypothetical protein